MINLDWRVCLGLIFEGIMFPVFPLGNESAVATIIFLNVVYVLLQLVYEMSAYMIRKAGVTHG